MFVYDMKPRISPLTPRKEFRKRDAKKCKCGNIASSRDGLCRRCRPTSKKTCKCSNTASQDGFCKQCRPKVESHHTPKKAKRLRNKAKSKGYTVSQRKGLWKTYSKRNEILSDLGFNDYREYLQSPLWLRIRKKVIRHNKRCVKCKKKAGQVHHSKYTRANLAGDSIEHLHAVCKTCHETAEVRPDGSKASLKAANDFLLGNGSRGGRT